LIEPAFVVDIVRKAEVERWAIVAKDLLAVYSARIAMTM